MFPYDIGKPVIRHVDLHKRVGEPYWQIRVWWQNESKKDAFLLPYSGSSSLGGRYKRKNDCFDELFDFAAGRGSSMHLIGFDLIFYFEKTLSTHEYSLTPKSTAG